MDTLTAVFLILGVLGAVGAVPVLVVVARWLLRRGRGERAAPASEQPRDRDSVTLDAGDRAATVHNVQVAVHLNIYVHGLPQAKPAVRDHFEEGWRLQSAERHQEAIEEFQKALAAAENDSHRCALHVLMGNSLFSLARLPEAEDHYRQALEAAEAAKRVWSAAVAPPADLDVRECGSKGDGNRGSGVG